MPPTGPLKVGPTGRYLVDQFGVPFSLLIDSGWECVTTLSTTDTAQYCADRVAKGFNTVPIELIDPEFNYGNTISGSTWGPNANGDLPFTTQFGGGAYTNSQTQSPDFTTPKSAYWSHADAVLNAIAASGLYILMYPFWYGSHTTGGLVNGYYATMAAQQASGAIHGFGQFLANRYGLGGTNPLRNIMLVPGGDNDPLHDVVNTATMTDLVAGWRSVDTTLLWSCDCLSEPVPSPRTGNSTGPLEAWPLGTFPGLWQVNNVYPSKYASGNYLYEQCQHEYTLSTTGGAGSTVVPCYFKEGNYENEQPVTFPTQQNLRSQGYQAMLSGMCGYAFGNNPVWLFASGWQTALNSTGSVNQSYANKLFASRSMYLLVPDISNTFLTNGSSYSDLTYATAAVASNGSFGIVYSQVGGTSGNLTINLAKFSGHVNASWYDPTSGVFTFIGRFANSSTHTFTPPATNNAGDQDQILLMETTGNCILYGSE